MSTVEAIGVDELVDLDRKVDAAEGEGIMARWEFGRELLAIKEANGGNQLPHGLLDELVSQTSKPRSEIQRRVQFAERYSTAEEVSKVCDRLQACRNNASDDVAWIQWWHSPDGRKVEKAERIYCGRLVRDLHLHRWFRRASRASSRGRLGVPEHELAVAA